MAKTKHNKKRSSEPELGRFWVCRAYCLFYRLLTVKNLFYSL